MDDGTIKDYKAEMRDYLFGNRTPKDPKEINLFLVFEKLWKVAEEENEQLKEKLKRVKGYFAEEE